MLLRGLTRVRTCIYSKCLERPSGGHDRLPQRRRRRRPSCVMSLHCLVYAINAIRTRLHNLSFAPHTHTRHTTETAEAARTQCEHLVSHAAAYERKRYAWTCEEDVLEIFASLPAIAWVGGVYVYELVLARLMHRPRDDAPGWRKYEIVQHSAKRRLRRPKRHQQHPDDEIARS